MITALLHRMMEMYSQARRDHRTPKLWRISPDLWAQLSPFPPEPGDRFLGIPVVRDSNLPPNGVVLA